MIIVLLLQRLWREIILDTAQQQLIPPEEANTVETGTYRGEREAVNEKESNKP